MGGGPESRDPIKGRVEKEAPANADNGVPDRIYGPDITNLISGTLLCQNQGYRPDVSGPKELSALPRDVSLYF